MNQFGVPLSICNVNYTMKKYKIIDYFLNIKSFQAMQNTLKPY